MFWKSKQQKTAYSPSEKFERQALMAFEEGDFDASMEYFRAALNISPMNRNLREGMRQCLEARSHREVQAYQKKKQKVSQNETELPPIPKKRKRKPLPKPARTNDGFAWMDGEDGSDSGEDDFNDLPTPRPVTSYDIDEDHDPVSDVPYLTKSPGKRMRKAARIPVSDESAPGSNSRNSRKPKRRNDSVDQDTELDAAMGTFAAEFKPAGQRIRYAENRPDSRSNRMVGIGVSVFITALIISGAVVVSQKAGDFFSSASVTSILTKNEDPDVLPEEVNSAIIEASTLLTDRKPGDAVALLDETLEENPDFKADVVPLLVSALRIEGSKLLGERRYDEATANFKRATELEPEDENNWIDYGRALAEFGRSQLSGNRTRRAVLLERAADAYRVALDHDEKNASALVGLGRVYTFLNERDKAVENYNRVVATAPHSVEADQAREYLRQLVGNRG